jgi:hypothetical protein
MQRLDRGVGFSIETISLFIRFWLMATPSLPKQTLAAPRTTILASIPIFHRYKLVLYSVP